MSGTVPPRKPVLLLRLLSLLALALFGVPQGTDGRAASPSGRAQHQISDTNGILNAATNGVRAQLSSVPGPKGPDSSAAPETARNPAPGPDADLDASLPGATMLLARPQHNTPGVGPPPAPPCATYSVLPPVRGPPVA